MKYRAAKVRPKESMSGRKIIMAIVAITSALSFTLGYFVGKSALKENLLQPQGSELRQQAIATPPQQEPAPDTQARPAQDSEQPPVTFEQSPVANEKTPQDKPMPLKATAVKEENNPPAPPAVYTIQAGAFKNLKDASALKRKLENKGYKAYIKKSADEKNVKLFKVRTGDFTDKKKAEDIALKLKKSEGLNAFVTVKNEEAREGDKGSSNPRADKQEKPR
ncbi:MAG: hypothetical protein EPN94_11685 [Nitrospirae bacterium]|nr:MAG: hypothetical protein EPN94_11685 [Nitrospirota bacterium]